LAKVLSSKHFIHDFEIEKALITDDLESRFA